MVGDRGLVNGSKPRASLELKPPLPVYQVNNHYFETSRYFSGTDDEKTKKYNYWHGVLADYFEGVQDMDRKAEVWSTIEYDFNQGGITFLGF